MPNPCPVCSKINPAEAYYCYYDGVRLSKEAHLGPLRMGSVPFPTPFHFSDGQKCGDFNQLALACDNHWEEARAFLVEGFWPAFFASMGRLDLAASARQAATNPDLDRGLSQLLEKLPVDPDCVSSPKLAVESKEENLGQLSPGKDLAFDLTIHNEGKFLLSGIVSSTCDWLVFGDHAGATEKMFQTRSVGTIPVRVVGSKLRAGSKRLHGEIVVDTNGGTITVPVWADVPIRPFPKGVYANDVLAGARSPREIAVKAKEHPDEAALLFAQSAVKTWYESNGWTYPIHGSEVSGKAAVQQFFEALGLTKAPKLEIDTAALTFKGKIGDHQTGCVTIFTKESKPVYAQARSNRDWVRFGPVKYLGAKVEIPVEITVPPNPGETIQAKITIQGNGQQQFVVPVKMTVEEGGAPITKKRTSAVVPAETLSPHGFACPSCKKVLEFSAGETAATKPCPGCGQRLQIPAVPKAIPQPHLNKTILALDESQASPKVSPTEQAPAATAPRATPRPTVPAAPSPLAVSGPIYWVVTVVGAGLFILSLFACAFSIASARKFW